MSYKSRKKIIRGIRRSKPTIIENEQLRKNYGLRNSRDRMRIQRILDQTKKTLRSCNEQEIKKKEQKYKRIGILEETEQLSEVSLVKIAKRRLQLVVSDKFKLTLGSSRQKIASKKIMIGYKYLKRSSLLIDKETENQLEIIA